MNCRPACMIILRAGARSGAMTFGQTNAPSVVSHFPDARSRGIRREGRAAAGAASGRHLRVQPYPACAAVQAARQWLLQQPWVAHDRISLVGWANGASALLWAVRPQLLSHGSEPDFRSAVAFYPDCRLSSGLGWSARVPTL